ncbi:MAG TPA: transporter [Vicinamibacterales bacterium]
MTSALILTVLLAQAGTPPPSAAAPAAEPFKIVDNSFLVEEAFNQDPKVVQSFFGVTRQSGGDWMATFTQEFPVPGKRHQLSYMLVADAVDSKAGFGDVYLNYRLQVMEEGPGRPAFSPRVSAIVPSGRHAAGEGNGGLQINLPFSKQRGDFYFHWNAGFTWLPRGKKPDLLTPAIAGSAIYRLRPMINLMLESVLAFQAADDDAGGVARTRALTISPGIRSGWDLPHDTQVVIGAAVPVTQSGGARSVALFGYLSVELPFWK